MSRVGQHWRTGELKMNRTGLRGFEHNSEFKASGPNGGFHSIIAVTEPAVEAVPPQDRAPGPRGSPSPTTTPRS